MSAGENRAGKGEDEGGESGEAEGDLPQPLSPLHPSVSPIVQVLDLA